MPNELSFDRAQLPPYAVKFLATFLRFEFALKEAGYGFESGNAQVDWGRVATELGGAFFHTVRVSHLAPTILAHPPKQQITISHQLNWRNATPPRNVTQLLEAVRRVRNNLVHGGKSGEPEDDPAEPHRNERLILEAQQIIEHALLQLHNVRAYFEGRY